ncbi:MAG: hypothetical protein K0R84_830 [Clostridia bacterium]|nr:hypothetical protein [Clostridia bacterium]
MNEFENNLNELLDETRKLAMEDSSLSETDIRMYNPLVLAYIGDAVYDTFVRSLLVSGGSMQVAKLHKRAIGYVQAKAQAAIIEKLHDTLTEDELDIVRRGRNTKSATVPKNADINDYRYATGFEALIGYLYLTGNIKRLMELFEQIKQMNR